jgi:hypothetical protein
MHHFVGAKLRKRSLRPADCLSQGHFRPSETHRDPGGDKPQHELAGVTIIIRQVIGKLDAVASFLCHDAHFGGWSVCRKAVSVNRQPMSLGKVEEHRRIATGGNDPPGRGIRREPVLFEMLPPRHTLHPILSIQDVVRSTVGIEHGRRGRQLLEAASRFLATCAIARGSQDRPADCLQFHFAESAYPGEVVLLLMLHCDRPFRQWPPPLNSQPMLPSDSTLNHDHCGLLAPGDPASRRYARLARRWECLPRALPDIHRPAARNAGH